MIQLSPKNDESSLCYDVIITHQNLKIDKFGDFSSDIDFKTKMDIFRDDISLIINLISPPGDRREPLADTKCPPAAQRKQAKRACIYIYIHK